MLTYKAPQHNARRANVTPRALQPRVAAEHSGNHDFAGPYALVRKIGFGGMGEVYLAEHRVTKRRCAIKFIRALHAGDAGAVARFRLEAQTAARLCHPNTVAILDRGVTVDGRPYYVMEHLAGRNLDEIVRRFGALPVGRVVALLRQICSALVQAHARGLVHCDIKPANIVATCCDGRFDVAKLIDFGLVKSLDPEATLLADANDGAFVGSPLYAPPECSVGRGNLDGRSDIYSLGATAYHLLTGRPVFEGNSALRVIFAHANQAAVNPVEIQGSIPAPLAAIIMKCLEKSPEDRFQTVTELDEALAATRLETEWTPADAAAWWRSHADENGVQRDQPPVSAVAASAGCGGIAIRAEKTRGPRRFRTAKC